VGNCGNKVFTRATFLVGNKMPYTFGFDLTNGIHRGRLRGRVTEEVLREFFQVAFQQALRTHPSAGVVDLSEVTSFEVPSETIRQLATATPVLTDPEVQRIVIAPTPHLFGMMRMFAMEGERTRPNLHVVHTEKEAWAILGVQSRRFAPLGTK